MILPILGSATRAICATVSTLASAGSLPDSESIRASSFLPRPARNRPASIASAAARTKAHISIIESGLTAVVLVNRRSGRFSVVPADPVGWFGRSEPHHRIGLVGLAAPGATGSVLRTLV